MCDALGRRRVLLWYYADDIYADDIYADDIYADDIYADDIYADGAGRIDN